MAIDVLFSIRGLLAFVAFTEFTSAGRALLSVSGVERVYAASKLFTEVDGLSAEAERTLARLFGLYSVLNGLIIVYAALYSHYKPVVSLAFAALTAKLGFMLSESLVFKTIAPTHRNLIFPVISGLVALVAVSAIPFVTASQGGKYAHKDENSELLKKMKFPKGAKQESKRK